MSSDSTPLLLIRRMSKSFPGLKAVDDVSLDVHAGEIVAVVGHNGSGKSTLVKILAGVYHADPGAVMEVRDAAGRELSGLAARQRLHFIHQDLGLVDILSTVENLGLSRVARGRGLAPVHPRAERQHAEQLIARFGASFDVRLPVGRLSPAERTIVAIARATDGWAQPDNVLVLDEPTTALHGDEVEVLFEAIRRVAALGAGVVFISHRLDEVLLLADRVVVLRDGRLVADEPASQLDHDTIVQLIVGRAVAELDVQRGHPAGPPVLEVCDVVGDEICGVSLTVRSEEIVGISGILGSGREQLAAMLFGARHRRSGRVRVGGDELPSDDINAAIEAGLAYLPADRRREGVLLELSVRENLTLGLLRPLRGRARWLNQRVERHETRRWMQAVQLVPARGEQLLKLFSGGNQQKVALAKCLRVWPKVLLLDEPTQGVDVGARSMIYELILRASRGGSGVVICSSDTKELVTLCDRVLVLKDGTVVSEVARGELSEASLIRAQVSGHAGAVDTNRISPGKIGADA